MQSSLNLSGTSKSTDGIKHKSSADATHCKQAGEAEACHTATLEANNQFLKATLSNFFTVAKKTFETEVAPGINASAEAKLGHVNADASVHFEKGKCKIEFRAGGYLARVDAELGFTEICFDAVETCYQLQLKAGGGIGWENSIAVGLDRANGNTKVNFGAGMGPVKWGATLRMRSKDPAKSHLDKSVELPEQTANELARTLLPLEGSMLYDPKKVSFHKFVNYSDHPEHLRNYAKSSARLLLNTMSKDPLNAMRWELQSNWLMHKDEVLNDVIKNMDVTEREAEFFTRLVEEEYYEKNVVKETIPAVKSEEARTAIKSFTTNLAKETVEFSQQKGATYDNYKRLEKSFQQVYSSPDIFNQVKTRKTFNELSEFSIHFGWGAHFVGSDKIRNGLFGVGQAFHLAPDVISTTKKSFDMVQGLFSGAVPISLGSALTVFTPLSAIGAFSTALTAIFNDEDEEEGIDIVQQMYSFFETFLQPVYQGLQAIQNNQKLMYEMQKVLHEQTELVLLNQEQLGNLLIENFANVRKQLDIIQYKAGADTTEVLTSLAGIRTLIQEFRQDDITLMKELVESALVMREGSLEECLQQLNCFVTPFIRAKTAVGSNALTAGEMVVARGNLQSILASLQNNQEETSSSAAVNAVNLMQNYAISRKLDGSPILSSRSYIQLSNPVGLYILIDILSQIVDDLNKRNKSIKKVFPGIDKHLKWMEEESTKLVRFLDDFNSPHVTQTLFYKVKETLDHIKIRMLALKASYRQEMHEKVKAKHAPIFLAEKQFLEREAGYTPVVTFTDYREPYHSHVVADRFRTAFLETEQPYLKNIHEMHVANHEQHKKYEPHNLQPVNSLIIPEDPSLHFGISFTNSLIKALGLDKYIELENKGIGYLSGVFTISEDKKITIKGQFNFYNQSAPLVIGSYTDQLTKLTASLTKFPCQNKFCTYIYGDYYPHLTIAYDNTNAAVIYWYGQVDYIIENDQYKHIESITSVSDLDGIPVTANVTKYISKEEQDKLIDELTAKSTADYIQGAVRVLNQEVQTQSIPTLYLEFQLKMLNLLLSLRDPAASKKLAQQFHEIATHCDFSQYLSTMGPSSGWFSDTCQRKVDDLQKLYPIYSSTETHLAGQGLKQVKQIKEKLLENSNQHTRLEFEPQNNAGFKPSFSSKGKYPDEITKAIREKMSEEYGSGQSFLPDTYEDLDRLIPNFIPFQMDPSNPTIEDERINNLRKMLEAWDVTHQWARDEGVLLEKPHNVLMAEFELNALEALGKSIKTTSDDENDIRRFNDAMKQKDEAPPDFITEDTPSSSASRASVLPVWIKPIGWAMSALSATFSGAKIAGSVVANFAGNAMGIFSEKNDKVTENTVSHPQISEETKPIPESTKAKTESTKAKTESTASDGEHTPVRSVLMPGDVFRVTPLHPVLPELSGTEIAQVTIPVVNSLCKEFGLFGHKPLSQTSARQNEMQHNELLEDIKKSLDEIKERPSMRHRSQYLTARDAFELAKRRFEIYYLDTDHDVTQSENTEVERLIDQAQILLTIAESLQMDLDDEYPELDKAILLFEKQQDVIHAKLHELMKPFDNRISELRKKQDNISDQLIQENLSRSTEESLNVQWDQLEADIITINKQKAFMENAKEAILFLLNRNEEILKSDFKVQEIKSIKKRLEFVNLAIKQLQYDPRLGFRNKDFLVKLINMVNTQSETREETFNWQTVIPRANASSMGLFSTSDQLAASVYSRRVSSLPDLTMPLLSR